MNFAFSSAAAPPPPPIPADGDLDDEDVHTATKSFTSTILQVDVKDWRNSALFEERLILIPDIFDDEDAERDFVSVLYPLVLEETRAKLNKCVGDEFENLPSFDRCAVQLYIEPLKGDDVVFDKVDIGIGYMWSPKVTVSQSSKWAKKYESTLELVGESTKSVEVDPFVPQFPILIGHYYEDWVKDKVPEFIKTEVQASDGHLFKIEFPGKWIEHFVANPRGILQYNCEVCWLKETLIPTNRISSAIHAFPKFAPLPLQQAMLFCNVNYIDPMVDTSEIQNIVADALSTLNESQAQAVRQILDPNSIPAVQIIKGPPGTGKTKTLVALLRILTHARLNVHVCAPTNAAVCELARRFFAAMKADGSFRGRFRHSDFLIFTRNQSLDGKEDEPNRDEHPDGDDSTIDVSWDSILPFDFESRVNRITNTVRELPGKIQEKILFVLASPFNNRELGDGIEEIQPVTQADVHAVACKVYHTLLEVLNAFLIFIDEYPLYSLGDWLPLSESLTQFRDAMTVQFIESIIQHSLDDSSDTQEFSLAIESLTKIRKVCNFIVVSLTSIDSKAKKWVPTLKHMVFESAQIIFSTVNVGGRYLFENSQFDVVVIDEAAQLVFAETAIVLRRDVKCVVLAGDEKQLPATVFSHHCRDFNYNRSLMERLLNNGWKSSLLQVQYRMHPHINRWPNVTFYNGKVRDGDNVLSPAYTKPWHNAFPPLIITDVPGEEKLVYKSFINEVEVDAVKMTINNLKRLNTSLNIGVIAPYRAQIEALKSLEKQRGAEGVEFSVRVSTVDSFQGQECDIIIFSAVRANKHKTIGFVRDERRLNVALTRAKYCLIVLCNFSTFANNPCWESLLTHAQIYSDAEFHRNRASTFQTETRTNNVVQELVARSVSRWTKTTARLVSFMQGVSSKAFEDAIWDLSISADFKQHVDANKVSVDQRSRLIEQLLRLVNGEWVKNIRSPIIISEAFKEMLYVFECGDKLFFLWAVDLDKRKKKQVIKLWDIGTRNELARIAQRVEVHYTRFSQQYRDLCCRRKQLQSFDQYIDTSGKERRTKGRMLTYPFEFDDLDERTINDLFDNKKKDATETCAVASSASFTKFFTFSSDVARFFLRSDEFSQVKLPFKMTMEEDQLVRNNASMFILGRSGTGKTTVLLHRMFLVATVGQQREQPVRQLLVTASQSLCDVIAKTYEEMLETDAKMVQVASSLSSDSATASEDAPVRTTNLAPSLVSLSSSARKSNVDQSDGFNGDSPWILTYYDFLLRLDSLIRPTFFDKHGLLTNKPPMTLERFKNIYYKRFSENSPVRNADLIYTEIMSTIKGSLQSLGSSKGYISEEQYLKLKDRRDSSLNADQRRAVYEHFLLYERLKDQNHDFDILDIVSHVFVKLQNNMESIQQSSIRMDFVYIDEVQDLVPAQIALFKFIGSQVDGFIFAGDTAQTIANGVGFRFETVKDIFYKEFLSLMDNQEPQGDRVPKIWHLTENFRTHSGVVRIANSIVQLLLKIFPSTIDKLPDEYSQIDGPLPIVVDASGDDHALKDNLHANLGADQVILVRDDDSKERLYNILGHSKGLILTVYEAKGMEFADCLLYNFFTNSPLQNEWRVLYNWITSSTEACPRFDPQKHERLCVELKKLYVLLTRAKQHLVIMESDFKWRKPIFDYWLQEELVTVKPHFDEELQTIFSVSSSAEDWSKRGLQFFERKQFANAQLCFERAGNEPKAKLCAAYEAEQRAEKELVSKPELAHRLYKDAGDLFASLIGQHPQAGNCYRLAKQFELAADQFILCNDHIQAAECYEEVDKLKLAAEQYARAGSLDGARRCAYAKSAFKYFEETLLQILIDNHSLSEDMEIERIRVDCVRRAALHYHDKKDIPTMMSYVERFSSSKQMKIFLNRYHHYDKLLDIELKDGNFAEVGRIYEQRKEYKTAAEYYAKAGNNQMTSDCLRCLLVYLQRACIGEKLRLRPASLVVEDESLVTLLKQSIDLMDPSKHEDAESKGEPLDPDLFSKAFADRKQYIDFLEADVYRLLIGRKLTPIKAIKALDAINEYGYKPHWRLRFALFRAVFLDSEIVNVKANEKNHKSSSRRGRNSHAASEKETTAAATAEAKEEQSERVELILDSHAEQLQYLQTFLHLVQDIMSFITEALKAGEVLVARHSGSRVLATSNAAATATAPITAAKSFLNLGSNAQRLEELQDMFFMETVKNGSALLSLRMRTVAKNINAYYGVFSEATLVNNDHHTMQLREMLQNARTFIFQESSDIVAKICRSFAASFSTQISSSQLMEKRALALSTIMPSKRVDGSIPTTSFPAVSDVMMFISCLENQFKGLADPSAPGSAPGSIVNEMMSLILKAKEQLKQALFLPIRSLLDSLSLTTELRCEGESKEHIHEAHLIVKSEHDSSFNQVGMMHDAIGMSLLISEMLGCSNQVAYRLLRVINSEWDKRKWDPVGKQTDSRLLLTNAFIWETLPNSIPLPNGWKHGNFYYGVINAASALCRDYQSGGLRAMTSMVDEERRLKVSKEAMQFFREDGCLSPLTFLKLAEKYFTLLMLYVKNGGRNVVLPLQLAKDVLCRSNPALVLDMQYLIKMSDYEAYNSPAMRDVVYRAQLALKEMVKMLLNLLRYLNYAAFEQWYRESKTIRGERLFFRESYPVKEAWIYFVESVCSLLFVQLAGIRDNDHPIKKNICETLRDALQSSKSMLNSTSLPIYIQNALRDVRDYKYASIGTVAKYFRTADMPLVAIHVHHDALPVAVVFRNHDIDRMVLEIDENNHAVRLVKPRTDIVTSADLANAVDFEEPVFTAVVDTGGKGGDGEGDEFLELAAAAPPPPPITTDDNAVEPVIVLWKRKLKTLAKQAKNRFKLLSRDEILVRNWEKRLLRAGHLTYKEDTCQQLIAIVETCASMFSGLREKLERCEMELNKLPTDAAITTDILDWRDQLEDMKERYELIEKRWDPSNSSLSTLKDNLQEQGENLQRDAKRTADMIEDFLNRFDPAVQKLATMPKVAHKGVKAVASSLQRK